MPAEATLVKHIIEGGSLSSVEISENAKGIAQITIKVYREPGKEQEALDEAMRLYNESLAKGPFGRESRT